VDNGLFISAIVLAAGESRRMRKPKLLMPLGNGTILETAVSKYLSSRVSEVIVVLGYMADEAVKKLAGKRVRTVINPAYRQGMSTSIIAGMGIVNAGARGVMIGLADEPFIDSQTINKLLDEFGKHREGIVIPLYKGRRGHPVIFAIRHRDALMKLKGDNGGKKIINQDPDDIFEVQVDCTGINRDIDTMDDYRSLRERSESQRR
jgi:molybdenum cofactor cytidylyltransferase